MHPQTGVFTQLLADQMQKGSTMSSTLGPGDMSKPVGMETSTAGQAGGIDFLEPTQNAEPPVDALVVADDRTTQL